MTLRKLGGAAVKSDIHDGGHDIGGGMRMPKIAFLGTGLMGARMARHLLAAGHDLRVWNRTISKARALESDGAVVADTAALACRGADVVITMLSDGRTVAKMVSDHGLCDGLRPGALWLDMSSIKPGEARAQNAQLRELGIAHLDAPVSGGTKGAEAATLAIMVGGAGDDFARAAPILAAMGRPVLVGPSGAGQLAKLANQAIVAVTIGAVAEATLLLEKGGADPGAVRDALTGGFADSVILQQHGARMSARNFIPGGLSKFQLKDLDNLLDEATDVGLELPVSQHIRDRFADFCENMGGGDMDHSGLFLELLKRNGLEQ